MVCENDFSWGVGSGSSCICWKRVLAIASSWIMSMVKGSRSSVALTVSRASLDAPRIDDEPSVLAVAHSQALQVPVPIFFSQ